MVVFYDQGLTAMIKEVFSNTIYQSRELTLHTVTDKNSKVTFPLISLFRPDGWGMDPAPANWATYTDFQNGFQQVPLTLVYQIDIYGNTREQVEEVAAELLLYLLRNRAFEVNYYCADRSLFTNLKVSLEYVSGLEDTSELDDKTVGRPYRGTFTFKLNNAYLLAFADADNPESPGYIPKVTKIIVEVTSEATADINTVGTDETHKPEYIDKEEIYGKN